MWRRLYPSLLSPPLEAFLRPSLDTVYDIIFGICKMCLCSGCTENWVLYLLLYLTYLVAIIFGVGFSGTMATFLVCVRVMVTPSVLAKSMSIVGMSGWIGMAFGGLQGGVLFDLTGTYYWSFAVGSIAGVINLIVIFSFHTYLQRYKQV